MSTTKLTVGLLGAGLILGLAGCGEKDGDDTGASVVEEICDNNLDDDGDGAADCLDAECADLPACAVEDCTTAEDDDEDGLVNCEDPDCESAAVCDFFEPAGFALTFYVGVSDGELTGYSGVSQGSAFSYGSPLVLVELFEEEYFEDYDDRYSCAWAADMDVGDLNSFGNDALWYGWEHTFAANAEINGNLEANGALCNNLDESGPWGEPSPEMIFEGLDANGYNPGFAIGALGGDIANTIETQVGADAWAADWEPVVFGGYTSLDGAQAGNYHYCFASQTDESMAIQYEEDGTTPIAMEVGDDGLVPPEGVEDLGPYHTVTCQSAFILYTSNIGL